MMAPMKRIGLLLLVLVFSLALGQKSFFWGLNASGSLEFFPKFGVSLFGYIGQKQLLGPVGLRANLSLSYSEYAQPFRSLGLGVSGIYPLVDISGGTLYMGLGLDYVLAQVQEASGNWVTLLDYVNSPSSVLCPGLSLAAPIGYDIPIGGRWYFNTELVPRYCFAAGKQLSMGLRFGLIYSF